MADPPDTAGCIANTVGIEPGSQGIAAIVNDDVISHFDVDSITIFIFSSGLPRNQSNYQRLKGQALTGLINERLKLQEAKQRKIKVSQERISNTIASIEKRNKLTKGALIRQFRQIDIFSYERQLEAELAWNQIIRREVSKSGIINQESIDQQISLIRANKGKPEYLGLRFISPLMRRRRQR